MPGLYEATRGDLTNREPSIDSLIAQQYTKAKQDVSTEPESDIDTLIKEQYNHSIGTSPEDHTSEPPSVAGSFIRSALRGLPSAAAAGTVGRLGMATSPVISPFGAIPLSIAGAGTAAYLTRKYQDPLLEKILPTGMYQGYKQSEEQDVKTNPIASKMGDFISQIGSGYLPSPGNVLKAGGSALKLAGGRTLLKPETANLVNVGTGAAIAPAVLAGQSAMTGQSPTLSDYAQSSLGGLLFNKNILSSRNAPPPVVEQPPPVVQPPPAPRPRLELPLNTESGLAELNRPGNVELTPEQLVQRANARLQPKIDLERQQAQELASQVPSRREVLSKRGVSPEIPVLPKPTVQLPSNLVPGPMPVSEIVPTTRQPTPINTAQEVAMTRTGLQRSGKVRPIIQPTIDELIAQQYKENQNAPKTSSIEAGTPVERTGVNEQLPTEGNNRDLTSPVEGEGNKTISSDSVLGEKEKSVNLTKDDVQEMQHKLGLLADNEDLLQEYGITKDEVQSNIPNKEGQWNIPNKLVNAVNSEMLDHVEILRDIASDASSGGKPGQASKITKQANKFEKLFSQESKLEKPVESEGNLPTNIQAALRRIKEKSGGQALGGVPDPSILGDLAKVASYYARKGIDKFREYLPKDEGPEVGSKSRELSLGYFKPQIQKIKEISPSGDYVGGKLEKFYFDKDKLAGLGEDFSREAGGYSKQERNNAETYLQDQQDTGGKSKIALTPDEQQLVGHYKKLITDPTYTKSGIRELTVDPNYYPQKLTPDVVDILLNHGDTPQAAKLKQDFIDYQTKAKGMTVPKAETRFRDLVQSYKSPEQVNRASQFGPLDKAEGYGIPLSWRERDIVKNVTSYTSRAARRLSYHNNIETDPLMRESLGIKTDPSGKPSTLGNKLPTGENVDYLAAHEHVTPVVKDIEGRFSPAQAHIASAQRIVRSAMLGTQTGVGNLIGSQVQGWQHMKLGQVPGALAAGWKNLNQNLKESTLAGVNRVNHSSLEFRNSEFNDITQHLNDVANVSNKIQGKNFLERVSRATNWGQGKYLAMAELNNGNKTGKSKFLDDFYGPGWKGKKNFSPEELSNIASKYLNSVQGTYDYRGLPEAYVNSPYSTILALSRWSGEKANNYTKYVVNPLLKGDPKPFLMQTAGMVLGGSVVEKVLESLGGRKSNAPNFTELKAGLDDKDISKSDEAQAIAYKMMSLATLAGTGGMISNLGKSAFDVMNGNRPQSIGDPLWEAASKTGETLVHAYQAFKEGEPNLGINLVAELIKDNIQGGRLALNNLSQEYKGNIERGNKARDLKVYESMHGHPPGGDIGGSSNPFIGKDLKSFRNSTNVNEIVTKGGEILNRTLSKDQGKPELLIGDLNKMRTQSRSSMPSMEGNTPEFVNYYNWILKTQGRQAASKLMDEYLLKEKGYDEIRKGMVPSVK